MKRYVYIAVVVLGICAGFAAGWLLAHHRVRPQPQPAAFVQSSTSNQQSAVDCDHAPDSQWNSVQGFFYQPTKALYNVQWQFCSGELREERVRLTDDNFKRVFFEYRNDEIERLEELDLLGNHVPQVLVITTNPGTEDESDWHVIGESNGNLLEWKRPDYDARAEKLLRPDEDFCCKDWNFHLQKNEVVLARGIYRKDIDGNCCPSRGGVLVRLKATPNAFELVSIKRLSQPEYYIWRSQPFCLDCTLR